MCPLAPNQPERRRHKRFAVMGKLPAKIYNKNGDLLTYIVVDVSKRGLGLLVDEKVSRNETVLVRFDIVKIKDTEMTVRWAVESDDHGLGFDTPVYRCGLEVISDDNDLETIFRTIDGMILEDMD
jgi:hypothetical protein